MSRIRPLVPFALAFALVAPSVAQTDRKITMQGYLTSGTGAPIADGTSNLTFRLYTTVAGGTAIWQETRAVGISKSRYSVSLGTVTPLPLMTGTTYLSVQVEGEAVEMAPRLPLHPPPTAMALPYLRTEATNEAPNIIGGALLNSVKPGATAVVVLGGSDPSFPNSVYDDYSTVSGGIRNSAGRNDDVSQSGATVSGGIDNEASGERSVVAGGSVNHATGFSAVVAGGNGNRASGTYSVVAGGQGSLASGDYSFAAGRHSRAIHPGAFVWADSQTSEDLESSKANQMLIRAGGGVRLLSNAGSSGVITVGDRYRDNAIVAWARVTADGTLDGDFGIGACLKLGTGHYRLAVTATAASASTLVPLAIAEVEAPPTSAAAARLVTINQESSSIIEVFITNGAYASVDNDFTIMVTGR